MNYKIEHLPTALLSLRLLADLSLETVAELAASQGLDGLRVEPWENGEAVPSYEELVTLLGLYERTFIDLEIMLEVCEEAGRVAELRRPEGESPADLPDVEKVLLQYVDAGPDSPQGRFSFEFLKTFTLMAQVEGSHPIAIAERLREELGHEPEGKDGYV